MSSPGKEKKVLVAMSGGVDSSVAASILLEEGYDVVGATLRFWVDPLAEKRAGDEAKGCCSYDAVQDARSVAAMLGIPHYVFDMKEDFFQHVVCNFTAEYLKGRTPNPCIECNRAIKFSILRRKAASLGIDLIATGHYAQIVGQLNNSKLSLLKGLDRNKDQSYMLYMLGQKDLGATIFPLGSKSKQEVREIALDRGLKVAGKAESQEICFIPDNDYRSFMERTCPEATLPGDLVSLEGEVLGRHGGIAFYTIGQRKGLGLTTREPYYVVEIDAASNLVVVGREKETFSRGLLAGRLNYIDGSTPEEPLNVEVKIRYRTPAVSAVLYPPQEGFVRLIFAAPQKSVAPGQSAVFYHGEKVIGGGIIESAIACDDNL